MTTPCDLVLLPSSNLAAKAISTSRDLQSFGALFELDGVSGPFPHISLYMTQLNDEHMDEAKKRLADIAKQTSPLYLNCTRYSLNDEHYTDAEYGRLPAIVELQMVVVNAINPIRDGMREKDKARMLAATSKVRESLEKYGYRSVGELYRPHMTFTRFQSYQPEALKVLPDRTAFDGEFVSLGLFEMGDNGTCKRLIAEFQFGGEQ